MRRLLIPSIVLASAAMLTSCAYDQTTCTSGGCGYVSTPSYVTTTGCCGANKTYVVRTTCCPTCNRCGSSYYGSAYDYDIGYGYGYGSYNTGWY